MELDKKYLGEIHKATAKNGCTFNVIIEDTDKCKNLCKLLGIKVFKDAVKKERSKPKNSTNSNRKNDDK